MEDLKEQNGKPKVENFTKFPLRLTETLHRHPQNPNYHPKVQIDALCEVLIENGWRSPVVVSKRSGLVIKGHGRIEAAERLGIPVPVEEQEYADEAAEIRDLIADNKIQELSQLDDKTVQSLVNKFKLKSGFGAPKTQSGLLNKSIEVIKDKKPAAKKFPILILETQEQYDMFEALKGEMSAKSDAALFAKILKRAFSEICGDSNRIDEMED